VVWGKRFRREFGCRMEEVTEGWKKITLLEIDSM
jgi:hypothetical protein